MNTLKLITPDFWPGKLLSLGRAICDIALFILRRRSRNSLQFSRLVLRVKPGYTMLSVQRLANLYSLAEEVNKNAIPGDIVECGVWNGGSAAIISSALSKDAIQSGKRTLWLFDSFQGLPQPGAKDGEQERRCFFEGWNKGDPRNVKKIYAALGLKTDGVKIMKGWFEETLPKAGVAQIALLHIDADWYDSVKITLERFYDKVSMGGYVVLDDYWRWQGCRRAFDEFCQKHNIAGIELKRLGSSAFFQKPFQRGR